MTPLAISRCKWLVKAKFAPFIPFFFVTRKTQLTLSIPQERCVLGLVRGVTAATRIATRDLVRSPPLSVVRFSVTLVTQQARRPAQEGRLVGTVSLVALQAPAFFNRFVKGETPLLLLVIVAFYAYGLWT